MPQPEPPKRRVPSVAIIAPWALASLVLGCACSASGAPCRVPGDCREAQECLANQCRPLGSLPVSPQSARWVLLPERYRVRAETTCPAMDLDFRLPSLGGPVQAAFLVLPTSSAPDGVQRVLELEARLLIDPWPAEVPRSGVGRARAVVGEGTTARVDVTSLVQRWLDRPSAGHGLRVTAQDSRGASVALEQQLAVGARLELYPATPAEPPR
jgi:hypothetical protein